MKNHVLKVLVLTLGSVTLVAGMTSLARASENVIVDKVESKVVADKELRGFKDHPVHLGSEEKLFSVKVEQTENVEDMAAIYDKDGSCE